MHEFIIKNRDKVELFLDESKLEEVIRRKKPTKYFWCDMTDMFLDDYPDEWIDRCFDAILASPQHTHQILTKRAERLHGYITKRFDRGQEFKGRKLWFGTSVENQEYDVRIPWLLRTPAPVRFISYEPALGPLDLTRICKDSRNPIGWNCLSTDYPNDTLSPVRIDWVIAGGESGPGARPAHPEWFRSMRDQCASAGVAFFFKQWGAFAEAQTDNVDHSKSDRFIHISGEDRTRLPIEQHDETAFMVNLGKKLAGRSLDGREWNEFPA